MSTACTTAVFRHSTSKGSARLVLLAMADEANDEGLLTAYRRSQSWLARKANVDAGTVRRAIAALEELGEVEVLAKGDGRASSDYRLRLPGLDDEGVQPAPPPPAERAPTPGEVQGQGVQPAPPIIPLFPGDTPVSPSLLPFAEFWNLFPKRNGKRVGRADAERIWNRLAAAERAAAMVGVKHYAEACAAGRWAQDPHRWLEKARWRDWQEPEVRDDKRPANQRRVDQDRAGPGGRLAL